MRWSAWTGSFALAAVLSACAANQPAPPPARIAAVEAQPAPAQPPPPGGAQILAAQPA